MENTVLTKSVEVTDLDAYYAVNQKKYSLLLIDAETNSKAITDVPTYERAVSTGMMLATKKKTIKKELALIVKPARAAWKAAVALEKRLLDPVDEALDQLRLACGVYKTEQQRLERIEQEERNAEQKRKEEERQKKEQKKIDAKQQEDDDAKLAAAEVAEKAGDGLRANQILEQDTPLAPEKPTVATVPRIAPPAAAPPKIEAKPKKAVSYQKKWVVKVTDKLALIKAVAAGQVHQDALNVNQAWLTKRVRDFGGQLEAPGVTVWQENAARFHAKEDEYDV